MHVLTLNIEHMGMGRLGYAGLYTAAADIASVLQQEGVRVSEVWWSKPVSTASIVAPPIQAAEAFRLLGAGEISAIYTQYVQSGLVFVVAAHAWPRAVPIVSICHDFTAAMDPVQAWASSPSRHPADAVVVSSTAGAQVLNRMLAKAGVGSQLPAADVQTLPLGTFLPRGIPRREVARAERAWRADDVVFLWLGRFSERYKADLRPLLIALRTLIAKDPKVRFTGVGGDDAVTLDRLKAFAAELGIADRCEWLPDATERERNVCLAGADVLVNVADHVQETFGLAIIEAMACGLPVIASDWSGFRDLVQHGVTGLLVATRFDPAWSSAPNSERFGSLSGAAYVELNSLVAAMERLAFDGEERLRMGRAGRARVKAEFSWAALGRRYVDLFLTRSQLASGLPPRASPRSWMETAFANVSTRRLTGRQGIRPGSVQLAEVVRSIGDSDLRGAAERVARQFAHGGEYSWPPAGSQTGLNVDHAALMLLLKLGVLQLADEERITN